MSVSKSSITAAILGVSDSTSMTITDYDAGECGQLTYTATMTGTSSLGNFLSFDSGTQTLTLNP